MSTQIDERVIGFSGSREGMTPAQADEFRSWIKGIQPTEFHHGDCVGADDQATTIVREVMGAACVIHCHPPRWHTYRAWNLNQRTDVIHPAMDYLARNRAIVDATGQTIGAPKEPAPETPYHPMPPRRGGTWYTLGYAEKRGKPRRIMWPDGSSSASFPTPSPLTRSEA